MIKPPGNNIIEEAQRAENLAPSLSLDTPGIADTFDFVGLHLMASYEACKLDALLNFAELRRQMEAGIAASGAILLGVNEHVFPNGGYTALFLLAESHASIHTYPEHRSCFIDIFTCGLGCKPEKLDESMRAHLSPSKVKAEKITRGG